MKIEAFGLYQEPFETALLKRVGAEIHPEVLAQCPQVTV